MEAQKVQVKINPKQKQALASQAHQVTFLGGLGCGKSFVLGLKVLSKSCLVGSVGLLTAPVSDTLKNATLPRVQEAWAWAGIIEGTHYCINTRPPAEWGVKPFSSLHNGRILTWRWGSYTVLDTSDNFNKHRGAEYDYICIDERRDLKKGAYPVLVGRLRGGASKRAGIDPQIFSVTTPPDNPDELQDYLEQPNSEVVRSITRDNLKNLPEGYIDHLATILDERTFEREVLGKLIRSGSLVYYAFDSELNVVKQGFDPTAQTYMCWDFNATEKPMSVVMLQMIGGKMVVTKEFSFPQTQTETMCEIIEDFLKEKNFSGHLEAVGDSAGNHTRSTATRSDYAIMEQAFRNRRGYTATYRPTRRIKDRVTCLNALLKNAKGERRLFISDECPKLIRDFNRVEWKENGTELEGEKDKSITHLSDALSYYAYNFHDITA